MAKWEPTGNQRGWLLDWNQDDVRIWTSEDGTATDFATSNTALEQYHLSFVAFTYTQSTTTASVYVDDNPVASSATAAATVHASTQPFSIGGDSDGTNPADGEIRSCVFLDTVILTPLQIKDAQFTAWKGLNRI
jgi:hypothetical protein